MKLGFLMFALSVLFSTAANATLREGVNTLLVTVNNDTSFNPKPSVWVNPGETVTLIPDQVKVSGENVEGLNASVKDFTWTSKDDGTEELMRCDPENDCATSKFVPTEQGALFAVPLNMPKYILITVQNRTDGTYDQVTLWNTKVYNDPNFKPTTTAVSTPSDLPENENFDSERMLAPYGSFVNIEGKRGWTPYVEDSDFQPYTHGEWADTNEYGFVWMGEEPWARYVYHYGVWRHTYRYGWVWFELPGHVWRPHHVTFFYGETGVGWYPYWDGYTYHQSVWYNDGFWLGFGVGIADGNPWHWGHCYVGYNHFIGYGVYNHWVSFGMPIAIGPVYHYSYWNHYYGTHLGFPAQRPFVERRFVDAGFRPTFAHTPLSFDHRNIHGGGQVFFARPTVASSYGQNMHAQAVTRLQTGVHPAAGSVFHPDGRIENRSAFAPQQHAQVQQTAPRYNAPGTPNTFQQHTQVQQQPRYSQPQQQVQQQPRFSQPQQQVQQQPRFSQPQQQVQQQPRFSQPQQQVQQQPRFSQPQQQVQQQPRFSQPQQQVQQQPRFSQPQQRVQVQQQPQFRQQPQMQQQPPRTQSRGGSVRRR